MLIRFALEVKSCIRRIFLGLQTVVTECFKSRMSFDNTENENRPKTPSEEDCCGNSCNPCIFDVHKKLLEEWEKKKLNKLKVPPDKNFLSLLRYSKFIIIDISEASEDCIFIQLECGSENKNDVLFLSPSQHVIIKFSSTSKPYTPISWTQRSIKLLVKLYPNGLVSSYFRKLNIGDELFLRGPYGEFQYQRNSYKQIIMLSIGSGIAATYPLVNSIIQDELEDTKINMIAGFRSFKHVPLIKELRLLADYWNFKCTLYLSQESDVNITGLKIVNSQLDQNEIHEIFESYTPESSIILICGTSEFNESTERIIKEKQFLHYHVFR